MKRPKVTKKDIEDTIDLVKDTYHYKLSQKGNSAFVSSHEVLGHLTEEFHEYRKEVQHNDIKRQREELLDIVVICIHSLASQKEKDS